MKGIEKFTLEKCRSILGKGGKKFTDTQVLAIRDYLYTLAEIELNIKAGIDCSDLSLSEEVPLKQAA